MRDVLKKSRAGLREYLVGAQVISLDLERRQQSDADLRSNAFGAVSHSSSVDLFVLYELFLERERAVLTVFNMLKPEGNLLLGFCWVP